ncbi:hypothetical protein IFM89_012896 [Coptis chinensis]|uniref:NAD(P)-binding domain-containing protein n=1 Tax=Coptis chinensis TaxID=261450 RepID=A0A835HE48_9MAGN|nr:hypothetical protein IFM89_012896 [Coptis chinensis]
MERKVVCVTGGSGFIGSWIVKLLIQGGYTVHATVQHLNDEKETKHLEALEGAESGLRLFQMDLLDYDSLLAAIKGTIGVFHVASPCTVDRVTDPQLYYYPHNQMAKQVPQSDSTSKSQCGQPYRWVEACYLSSFFKTALYAEKAAWEFAKDTGLDVVVIHPGFVLGPILPPVLNASMIMLLRLLEGSTEEYGHFYMGPVHVKDVALAQILLYENLSASGRHLCVEVINHWSDFATKLAELYPEYKVPRFPKDTQPGLLRTEDGAKKLIDLGIQFTSMEETIKVSVESLKSKGYIS